MARVALALSLSVVLLGTTWAWNLASGEGHGEAPAMAIPIAADAAPDGRMADPEDGTLADGVYANRYFDFAYPLPQGWKAGLKGPPPSNSGYYVLNTPAPEGEPKGTILIAAQDMFFAAKPMANAMAMVADLRRTAAQTDGLKAETEPRQVTIAGHSFARVDIGGVVLSRIVLATDIRCHIVSFTFASPDPQLLDALAASLDGLSLPAEASATGTGTSEAGSSVPMCVENYSTDETILHKVAPASVGPKFLKIPVRIIIGPNGRVKHVHVIRAFPEQAKSIEDALAAWEFKPYEVRGQAAEIETGLVFEFKPTDR
jgi:hypothetical protein